MVRKNVENLYPVAFAPTDRDPTDLSAKKAQTYQFLKFLKTKKLPEQLGTNTRGKV